MTEDRDRFLRVVVTYDVRMNLTDEGLRLLATPIDPNAPDEDCVLDGSLLGDAAVAAYHSGDGHESLWFRPSEDEDTPGEVMDYDSARDTGGEAVEVATYWIHNSDTEVVLR